MILCRIPDKGTTQYYEVEDIEVDLKRRGIGLIRVVVPKKARGWRYSSHLGKGLAGLGRSQIEAEHCALEADHG